MKIYLDVLKVEPMKTEANSLSRTDAAEKMCHVYLIHRNTHQPLMNIEERVNFIVKGGLILEVENRHRQFACFFGF